MKNICSLIFIALLTSASFAADGKSVSYKSGDETVQAILYTPAGKGPFPAIIVIHEYWGLNDWVKEQASKLADQGYEALAIDLYRGKVATTPDMAHEIMRGVPEDRAKRDLHAAFEFLQAQPNVKKSRMQVALRPVFRNSAHDFMRHVGSGGDLASVQINRESLVALIGQL